MQCEIESSESACKVEICPTDLRKSLSYCRDYILIANFVMMVFIPLVILSAVNCHIYRFITISASSITTSSRQKRDQRIARILIVIVMVFTCCNVPRAVINLYEVRRGVLLRIPGLNYEEKIHVFKMGNP